MTDANHNNRAEWLLRMGLLSESQLETLKNHGPGGETGLTETIVRLGLVPEAEFLQKVGERLGIPFVTLAGLEPPREAVERLPVRAVFQYAVAPVAFEDGALTVAASDPFNTHLVDGLRLAVDCPVNIVLAGAEDIAKANRKYYGLGADTVDRMLEDGQFEAEEQLDFGKLDLSDLGQEASIVRFVNQIIAEADRQDATDIHFEPMEEELRIRYRIDGVLHKVDVPPQLNRVKAAVISRLKVMANMDIAEKRLPMDGRIGTRLQGHDIDIRVSTMPTVYGESVSLRLLQKSENFVSLSELGMSDRDKTLIDKIIHRPNGIVLVTGPTGSGKSTSLYAFLHEINTLDQRILTAEEPIEYEMPGINQLLVRPDIGLTFARALRSFLRQDPDIIMVGEIRDADTAEIAINASLTGHLVFSTLHTNDAAGAFARLIDMGVEPFLVASAVEAVMAQRLVRKLCKACRRREPIDPRLLEQIERPPDLPEAAENYIAVGCENCGGTGFRGRQGIFELLHVTDAIETLIINRRPSGEIKHTSIQEGMRTLRDDGWDKILSGVTTLEEVLRVTEENL